MANDSLINLDIINRDLYKTYCASCKDLFVENFKELGLKEPLRRLILVGKLKYADRNEVKKHHDDMIRSMDNTIVEPSSKPSGLMIIDKSFFYHVVEGSDEILNEVIECTANFVSEEKVHEAKVIRTSTIAFRHFENWHSCIIFTSGYTDSPFEELEIVKESNIPALANMITKFEDVIFVLASYVRYLGKDIEEKINDLVPITVLPFETELETLYKEPFFFTVRKYVDRYLKPQEYISYIEREWPPSGPVHDATDFFEEIEKFEKRADEKTEKDQNKQKTRFGTYWWSQ